MAKRPTPKDVPDAVRDAVDRTVQATIGSAQLTRGRAQEAVDELVRTAEAGAGAVREAVVGAFEERRPATSDDLEELRAELRRISRRLTAIERQLRDGGGPSPAGSRAAASEPKGSAPTATASRSKPARGAPKGSGGRRADAGGGGGGGASGAARGGSSGGASRGS
jgi:hypothetical protein